MGGGRAISGCNMGSDSAAGHRRTQGAGVEIQWCRFVQLCRYVCDVWLQQAGRIHINDHFFTGFESASDSGFCQGPSQGPWGLAEHFQTNAMAIIYSSHGAGSWAQEFDLLLAVRERLGGGVGHGHGSIKISIAKHNPRHPFGGGQPCPGPHGQFVFCESIPFVCGGMQDRWIVWVHGLHNDLRLGTIGGSTSATGHLRDQLKGAF